MKEYNIEENTIVDTNNLKAELMPKKDYEKAHRGLVIPCHDVFIKYQGGILLIKRNNVPVKGILWPIGGRVKRGLSTEDSLREKVLEECNLKIDKIQELGFARTYFHTDPFGHGHGTDTMNVIYFAIGAGTLKLDSLHEDPTIILPKGYTSELKNSLHPYVLDFMEKAMRLV